MHGTSGLIPQTLLVRVWVHETMVVVGPVELFEVVDNRTHLAFYIAYHLKFHTLFKNAQKTTLYYSFFFLLRMAAML